MIWGIKSLMRFLPVVFFISISITGCSTVSGVGDSVGRWMSGGEDNAEPPTPLVDIDSRVEIIKLWEKDIGIGTDKYYLKLSPAITQEMIFVADNDGNIKAINATNGNITWDQDIDESISGGPGTGDALVLVGTSEGEIIALSSESGDTLWRTKVSSEILATPKTANGIVIVRTIDGKIFGLSATAGTRLWIYDRTVPILTLRGTSAPVIYNNLIIAGFDGGRMAAIELETGKLIWETRIALGSGRSELERMVDIDADPLIMDNIIYVATYQGRIAAVALDTGSILWTRDISSYAGLCADDNNLYVTDDDSLIWALDRISGSSVWKQEKLKARAATAPAIIGDLIVVGDLEGYLHWMDKFNGQFVARTRVTDNLIIAPPNSINEILYTYASDGTLGAYTYNTSEAIITTSQTTDPDITVVEAEGSSENNQEQNVDDEKKDEEGFLDGLWGFFTSDDDEPSEPEASESNE